MTNVSLMTWAIWNHSQVNKVTNPCSVGQHRVAVVINDPPTRRRVQHARVQQANASWKRDYYFLHQLWKKHYRICWYLKVYLKLFTNVFIKICRRAYTWMFFQGTRRNCTKQYNAMFFLPTHCRASTHGVACLLTTVYTGFILKIYVLHLAIGSALQTISL